MRWPLSIPFAVLVCAAAGAQKLPFPDFARPAQTWSGAETAITDSRYLVIDEARAWKSLWREHAPGAAVPKVDFERAMVLAVFNPKFTKGTAFRIARVVSGALANDESSLNVILTSHAPATDTAPNRFAMIRVDRTRYDFRFYARGGAKSVAAKRVAGAKTPATKKVAGARMVARVDMARGPEPAASLVEAARELMVEYAGAAAERRRLVVARLAAFGEPMRPFWNRLIAAGGRDVWLARAVLARMLAEEVAATGKPVRFREVALAKAVAAVAGRVEVKGTPWYVTRQCRLVDGVWYAVLHGTFAVSSDSDIVNQKDVHGRVALRAADGEVLMCEIRRGDLDTDGTDRRGAAGRVPAEKQKKDGAALRRRGPAVEEAREGVSPASTPSRFPGST